MTTPDWAQVRASFPGLEDKVFLDAACVSIAPRQARDAVVDFVDAVVRMPEADATRHHLLLDEGRRGARSEVAALIGASADEIALVESTSHGLSLLANGLPISGGENIVLCDLEYVGVVAPWAARARESGIDLRFVRNREGRIEIDDVARTIDDNTRAICLSSVQWSNGYRIDLTSLSALARDRGIFLVLDAIQQIGAIRLDVRETPVDAIACGGHKWLNAPFGCGFLYVRREILPDVRPSLSGYLNLVPPPEGWGRYFATPDITPLRRYEFATTAQKLDSGGTSNYPGSYGLAASLRLINGIGAPAIEERIHTLADRLFEGLLGAGFRLVSHREREHRSGIITFTAAGDAALDGRIVQRLRERHVCISQRYTSRVGGLRVSVHFFNNEDDIDTLVREAVRARDAG